MALRHAWRRTLNGSGDVQQWPVPSQLINTIGFDAGSTGGATFTRGLFYPSVSTDVSATNQPVRDFVSEAQVFFCAGFDVNSSGVAFEPMSDDDRILAVALLEPTLFPLLGGTADYRVRWAPKGGMVQTFGQRKADLSISPSPSVNGCIKVVDFTGAIPNVLLKNIFTNAQVYMAGLWSFP